MKNQYGTVLIVTLIFLFVLTLLVSSTTEETILEAKMESLLELNQVILNTAESGVIQSECHLLNHHIELPDTFILLKTSIQLEKVDLNDNKTFLIQSLASYASHQVLLKVRDNLIKMPKPTLHRITWEEQ